MNREGTALGAFGELLLPVSTCSPTTATACRIHTHAPRAVLAGALDITLAQQCEVASLTKGAVMHEGSCCSISACPVGRRSPRIDGPPRHRVVATHRHAHPSAAPVHRGQRELVRAAKAMGCGHAEAARTTSPSPTISHRVRRHLQVNPPLRTAADIADQPGSPTAHRRDRHRPLPHPPESKEPPSISPPGMLGLETALALAITDRHAKATSSPRSVGNPRRSPESPTGMDARSLPANRPTWSSSTRASSGRSSLRSWPARAATRRMVAEPCAARFCTRCWPAPQSSSTANQCDER